MKNFGTWLLNTLQERKMTQSELARIAGISKGTVSNLINGTSGIGQDSLLAIARALRLPPEIVFRAAGTFPQQSPKTELIEQITHIILELPEHEQQDTLEFVKFRLRLAEERGKYETRNDKKRTAKT